MEKEKMEKEGWQLGSISSGEHLKRWLEEYKEMGFEVHLEPIDPSKESQEDLACTECSVCFDDEGQQPYRIYIKSGESVAQ